MVHICINGDEALTGNSVYFAPCTFRKIFIGLSERHHKQLDKSRGIIIKKNRKKNMRNFLQGILSEHSYLRFTEPNGLFLRDMQQSRAETERLAASACPFPSNDMHIA